MIRAAAARAGAYQCAVGAVAAEAESTAVAKHRWHVEVLVVDVSIHPTREYLRQVVQQRL